ncbi:gpW family head-tail joining protein [Brevundimonas sp. VNH65]|uniref:gpW family head-tail joining protein n=1 Tax=Brevundimonas sp. VNH65 TaxID=3400917 RepID=UPI003C01707A
MAEAEAAYHDLMVGRSAVAITDQSGEAIQYGRTRAADLASYIAALKREIAGQVTPHTIRFKTKGAP